MSDDARPEDEVGTQQDHNPEVPGENQQDEDETVQAPDDDD